MNVQIEELEAHLQPEFEKDYFRTLTEFRSEYSQYQIFLLES